MPEWVVKPLGELCDELTVGHVGSMASEYVVSGIPFLRSQNVKRGYLDLNGLRYISTEFHQKLKKSRLMPGDIVIVRTGEPGAAALIPDDFGELNCSDLVIARPGKVVDPRFLCYSINSTAEHYISAHLVGAVQQHFNVGSARKLQISLPPLSEQQAIAAVLGSLDDKIAVNGRIESTYEEILRSRFAELQIDVEPDISSAISTSELVEFNPALKAPRDSDAIYLDMAAVPTDRATVSEWSRREPKSGTRFANGDTVMARITPCLENGKTAFIDFMGDGEVGIGSTEFIVMRARPGIPIHLPYFLARSPRFRSNAVQNMVGSSGRQRVAAGQLVDFPIARSNSEKLVEFGMTASAAFAHVRSLTDESRNLAELRDTLLPKLMSGEIRVRDTEKVVEDVT